MSKEIKLEIDGVVVATNLDSAFEVLNELKQEEEKDEVTKELSEFFNKYPFITSIVLGAAGTYYKYECAGETYEDDESEIICDEDHPEFTKEKLSEAYSNQPSANIWDFIDDYPQRGGSQAIAYREEDLENGFYVDIIPYDPE